MEGPSMRDLICAVGGPLLPNENRKSWLARVAQSAGISPRLAAAAFYEETQSAELKQKLKKVAGEHEHENLARQFEGLAASIGVRDEDFYRQHADAYRDIARALRALVRPSRGENST